MAPERPLHPGRLLKERFLDPLGITPYRLARSIGVRVRRVSELVNGNRRVTPDTAIRLGLFFDVPPAWWLEMQARYDTEGVERIEELRGVVTPYEALAHVLVSPNGVRRLVGPDKQKSTTVLLFEVPGDLLERLRAQKAHEPLRRPRRIRTVTYSNGATALIGTHE